MNFLLLGKPNVGKTSIFNILTKNHNIVHKDEGTTRDWHKKNINNFPNSYLFDCPGIFIKNNFIREFQNSSFFNKLLKQIDTFLYVVDYKNSFDLGDNDFLKILRKYNKNILLLVNKYDNVKELTNNDFYKYGIKNIFFISCSHKIGFNKLTQHFNIIIPNTKLQQEINNHYKIAIYGKPNVGKSTFLNSILGYERSNTSKYPGTTSDIVEDDFFYKNQNIKIIDTAGIEKKSKIKKNSINFYSAKKSFDNLKKINLALVIIDSKKGIDRQDKRLIKLVSENSKNIIIIFNKFDLIDNKIKYKKNTIDEIYHNLSETKNIKIFFISAFLKKNVIEILKYININVIEKKYSINTSKLNIWLKKCVLQYQHPLINNKKVNFKYALQVKENPVIIKIFCNYSNKIKKEYKKYLINNLNKKFKITNQKTNIIFSKSNNPYN